MHTSYETIQVLRPIDEVWARVADFYDLSWAPHFAAQCQHDGPLTGVQIGAKRVLDTQFVEVLLEYDEDHHLYRYRLEEGPGAFATDEIKNYVAELHLMALNTSNSTYVECSAHWLSARGEAEKASERRFQTLLHDLKFSMEH